METTERRYADFETRVDDEGRTVVEGTIIRYGDVATLPWGTEEFKAGAFTGRMEDIVANRMHQRDQPLARTGAGLTISDDERSMRASLTLPDTNAGRDTAVEVAARLLRGLSLEFRSIKDSVTPKDGQLDGHRVITEAVMYGFGVVDKPAYPDSVLMRSSWAEYKDAFGYRDEEGPEDEPDEDEEVIEEDEADEPRFLRLLMV